ncbi:transcriptional activator protein UGA3 [Microdochium nivale]|nr:transcriptional activator protein UGA3 [Microdochium nivale]
MPPRRSHKKSRAGCKRCKSRKIKCDEARPRCSNCTKHGVPCDFEYPEIASSFPVAETPRFSPSECATSPAPSAYPPTPAIILSTHVPLYRSPDHAPITPASNKDRMMELKLLHHYTTMTCKTLAIRDASSERIWSEIVPNLAFSGANYLADALLAVAALHLRSAAPHDQQLIRASHSYMAATLSEYAASLSKGITNSNAEALFLTSALIAFQSTASRVFVRDEGGGSKDQPAHYHIPLSWFHSFQGVKAVVASSWQFLRHSRVVLPIIEAQPALNLHLGETATTHFGHLLAGLEKELAESGESPEDQALTAQAYHHAVAVMNWVHKIPQTGAPLVFLATVSKRFIDLLEAKKPRALAILANYFGLLKLLDRLWWLKGVSRREIMGIISLFDPDDEVWWPTVQWPLRIALYNGDVIPPELWGLNMTQESTTTDDGIGQNSSFVTHIEVLSEMFDSLQNGTGPVMDMVAHGNDVFQRNSDLPRTPQNNYSDNDDTSANCPPHEQQPS